MKKLLSTLFAVPIFLVLTLLLVVGASLPLVTWVAHLVKKWQTITRCFWDFLLPDWYIFDLHGRQLDLLTLFSIMLLPLLSKPFQEKLKEKVLIPALSFINIDLIALEDKVKVDPKIAMFSSILLLWYFCIDDFTVWGIIRPIACFIVACLLFALVFSVFNKEITTFFPNWLRFLAIIMIFIFPKGLLNFLYQPGNFLLQSFELNQTIEYFGENHTIGYMIFCVFFYLIFICLASFLTYLNSKKVFFGLVVLLVILAGSYVIYLLDGPVTYVDTLIKKIE